MGLLGGIVARTFYYPSILYNVVTNKLTGQQWYNRINDHIILGAIPLKFLTKDLVKHNVKGVVALNEDYELRYMYNTEEEWKRHGIRLLRIATQDLFASPSIPDIQTAIGFIDEISKTGGTVYVHCKAGKTRSTTVVACYLIQTQKISPDSAYDFIKSKRPQVWLRKPQLDCLQKFYASHVQPSDKT